MANTDVTLLEGRGVIDTVTGDSNDLTAALVVLDDQELVGRGHAGKDDLLVAEGLVPLGGTGLDVSDLHDVADVVTADDSGLSGVPLVLVDDSDLLGDGLGGDGVGRL